MLPYQHTIFKAIDDTNMHFYSSIELYSYNTFDMTHTQSIFSLMVIKWKKSSKFAMMILIEMR